MKRKMTIVMISFIILSLISFSNSAQAGSVSSSKIFIPYVNFNIGNISLDGKAIENGFFNFSITTDSGIIIQVAFRHNNQYLHVVLNTKNQGWLAMGWHNSTPVSTTGAGPMVGANVIIGGNNTARDDTGAYATHTADSVNNIVNYSAKITKDGSNFEFIFPLQSSDPVDQPLTIGGYGFFIFATGTSADLKSGHGGSLQAMYLPYIYIESSAKEGYKVPENTAGPFINPELIILTLAIISVISKKKLEN